MTPLPVKKTEADWFPPSRRRSWSPGKGSSRDLGLPHSTLTSLPIIGALVNALPDIIQRAADARCLVVQAVQAPPPDELAVQFSYPLTGREVPDTVIQSYMSVAASDPTKLRALVASYTNITKVEGLTIQVFFLFRCWN